MTIKRQSWLGWDRGGGQPPLPKAFASKPDFDKWIIILVLHARAANTSVSLDPNASTEVAQLALDPPRAATRHQPTRVTGSRPNHRDENALVKELEVAATVARFHLLASHPLTSF